MERPKTSTTTDPKPGCFRQAISERTLDAVRRVRCTAGRGTCLSQRDRHHPPPHAKTRCNRDVFFVSRATTDPSHGVPPWGTCLSQRDRHVPCSAATSAEIVDGVLECARQSAASTPLWSCPKRQTSLARREAHPLTPNQDPNQSVWRDPVPGPVAPGHGLRQ